MAARLLAICCLFALLSCPAAAGAADLRLTWNDCPEGGGLNHREFSCNLTLGSLTLVPSFRVDAPIDSAVALEIVIDVVSGEPTLPDWWRFDPGGCNAGALSANTGFASLGSCDDPWNGSGVALAQTWWVGQPRGGANQARLVISSAVSPAQPVRIEGGTSYYAALVQIALQRTMGPASCLGCLAEACLVLNSIQVQRLPGTLPETVVLEPTVAGTPGWATWQNDGGLCGVVPVRNRTWGAVKTLYR